MVSINGVTASYMLLNFIASVAIIWVNKLVFKVHHFDFGTTLTFFHFVVTFAGLYVCKIYKLFEVKTLKVGDVLPLCGAFCGFVVFNNLSLLFNTVSVYQLMKVMTTPTIVTIQYSLYGVSLDNMLKLSLVPVCIGVTLATVSSIEMTLVGAIYGVLGIVSASMYQIWVGTKQKELGVNSMQLLFYQAPISAILLIFCIPFFDNVSNLLAFEYTFPAVSAIVLSSVLAFVVNLSIFLVIAKTSPISYNVLGHCKLCAILIGGFVLFGDQTNTRNMIGILMTICGIVWYTHLKMAAAPPKELPRPATELPSKSG
eukprot:GILJ01004061.1.p1 GENE.GILJ01004061.1~~GILJ01004061.1.p1  ORF type:complete len:320 (-),score=44.79 GILJ01004061.1:148-1086(-)